jgi:hypothetical protein
MTRQLTWLEHRGALLEAAALRQDIHEAHAHIERFRAALPRVNRNRASTRVASFVGGASRCRR